MSKRYDKINQVRIWPHLYLKLKRVQAARLKRNMVVPSLADLVNEQLAARMDILFKRWMP